MRIIIDASDPLEYALRVLGAAYGVHLTVAGQGESATAAARDADGTAANRSRRAQRPGGRGSKSGAPRQRSRTVGKPDTAAVRQWAREHGLPVPDRGRIPKEIVRAYEDAVTS